MITDFRLQVFVTTARVLSFTRAAEELNVSQPAVTKHIKELEKMLSVALFRRGGSRIKLTEEGERLLPLVQGVLQGYMAINDAVAISSGDYSGRLRIGASSTIAQYILPDILAKFRLQYPSIEIVLMGGNSEEILLGLEQERIDIALVEDAHTSSAFHYEHFAQDSVVLVSSNKRPQQVSLEEVREMPLVLRENGSGTLDVIERELMKHNITRRMLNVQIQIGSSEGIMRYLIATKCYAFISRAAVGAYLKRGELYMVDIDGVEIARSLRFATLHGRSNRLSELFKEYCNNF
ncbi:MAG: LysR substrate-binding domain-containing protein [Rikenellaceae bacterium]